jgi:uncharacterized protein (TIGR02452 family)
MMTGQIPSSLPPTLPPIQPTLSPHPVTPALSYTSSITFGSQKKLFVALALLIVGSLFYLWKYVFSSNKPKNPMSECFRVTLAPKPEPVPVLKFISSVNGDLTGVDTNEVKHPAAQTTLAAIVRGHYINCRNEQCQLNTGLELLNCSEFISNTEFDSPGLKFGNRSNTTEIVIVEQDCLYAAQKEVLAGEEVAVLMFASPLEAGGGMHDNGHDGQEEMLARRSNIFGFLWDLVHHLVPDDQQLYPLLSLSQPHQPNPDYDSLTRNGTIHVPHVKVFRAGADQNYAFLDQPFRVGMILAAPPDQPALNGTEYARAEDLKQLERVIGTILGIASTRKYSTLVLGSFGCGAFKNPPHVVAKAFRKIIETRFQGAFKKIIFPILDTPPGPYNPKGNLKPFQDVFSGRV